jgi:FtsX-like permease family
VTVQGRSFAQVLDLFYVLLALSVIISVFGMINTLVLAVFERTRELGMLRAIGLHKSRPGVVDSTPRVEPRREPRPPALCRADRATRALQRASVSATCPDDRPAFP